MNDLPTQVEWFSTACQGSGKNWRQLRALRLMLHAGRSAQVVDVKREPPA